MTSDDNQPLAKLCWNDPTTQRRQEFLLTEGATATIGRSSNNDIQIPEQHVSRQHAVITYRDGVFMVDDLGSSNGTFVNDQKIEQPFPLFAGDLIRLFHPTLDFLAITEDEDIDENSQIIKATNPDGQGSLIVTNGPQEGQTIPLLLDEVTIGRATSTATWEILLQDPSVSRPHARLKKGDDHWLLIDLNSSNGTSVNGALLSANAPEPLKDGDKVELGGSVLLFRTGWESPSKPGSAASNSLTKPMQE
ncbi:MAG: FHA domain-containing protein [Chloroflexota bacterium]